MEEYMTKKQLADMPTSYALVLQYIYTYGKDDLTGLIESMNFDRAQALHIVSALKNKGLVFIDTTLSEPWVRLSHKGQRFLTQIWSESRMMTA